MKLQCIPLYLLSEDKHFGLFPSHHILLSHPSCVYWGVEWGHPAQPFKVSELFFSVALQIQSLFQNGCVQKLHFKFCHKCPGWLFLCFLDLCNFMDFGFTCITAGQITENEFYFPWQMKLLKVHFAALQNIMCTSDFCCI